MSTVERKLEEIRSTIEQEIPSDIAITEVRYEGPELVIYTRDPKRFARDGDLVRQLASKLRKRITVRPDPAVLSKPADARGQVLGVIPEEAGVTDLATTAKRRDPHPLVVGHLLAMDLPADPFEDVAALVALLLEEVADVFHRGGLDRRRPNHLGRPSDLLGDLP